MKKILCFSLALVLIFALCGCNDSNSGSNNAFDDGSEEYFDFNDEQTNTGEQSEDKNEVANFGGNSGGNNTANNTSSDNDEHVELMVTDGFTPKTVPSRKNAYKLTNTMNKLKSGGTLNVAYYGGSVTSGTGSSYADKKSWRALTTAYLKTLTSGSVNETNAALGGTGTYLGAARFENSVLKSKPDLLFIEFSINDYYSGLSAEQSKMNIEYMVTKLYKQNPYADIVMVLLCNDSCFGQSYKSYEAHKAVADYYKIPIVDFSTETYNKLGGSLKEFKKLLSDSVHPNDQGYKIYGDIMIGALKELLVAGTTSAHTVPSSKLCANGYSTLKNNLAANISASGWSLKSWFNNKTFEKEGSQFRDSSLKNYYPKYLAPDQIGNSFTFNFTGNSLGMLGTIKEGVVLTFVLDGGTSKAIKGTSTAEMLEYPVFEGIANSAHTVTITVSGEQIYTCIAALITTTP